MSDNSENTDFIIVDSEPQGESPKRKKADKSQVVFLIVIALAVVGGILNFVGSKVSEKKPVTSAFRSISHGTNNVTMPGGKDFIGELHIEGVIEEENSTYNQKNLLSALDDLAKNKKNKGLLLKINSPGGTIYESDEMYKAVMKYKEETKRPVWAYIGSMGASGGYYIACGADKIVANRNSLVGSIGVISGTSVDMTALFERLGVKVTTFHSGRNKTMLSSNEPLTEEQREIMQSISDEAYDQFVSVVADSRVLPVATVTELADGRIYTAAQAKNLRLLDDVLFWEDFCTQMKEACGLGSDGEIQEISTVEKDFWHDFWHGAKGLFRQISLSSEERLMEHVMSNNVKFPAYYYGGF